MSVSRLPRLAPALGLSIASLLLAVPLQRAGAAEPPPLVWRHVATPSRGEAPAAVAVDGRGLRVAVADAAGVALAQLAGEGPLRFHRVARVAGAHDLAFGADGALWIAGADGLWRLTRDGRLDTVAALPGAGARVVHRVAARGPFVAVATGSGLALSADGVRWSGVGGVLATTPVDVVAFGPVADSGPAPATALWAAVGSDIWRIEVRWGEGGLGIRPRKLNAVASRPTAEEPVDLWTGDGGEVVAVYPTALAVLEENGRVRQPGLRGRLRPRPSPRPSAAGRPPPRWRVVRPGLPPGARALRLARAAGRYWLVHDRGLSWAVAPDGPWRRAGAPAGVSSARDLAAAAGGLFLASSEGLLHAHTGTGPGRLGPGLPPGPPLEPAAQRARALDPDIAAVHRAVLRAQRLGGDRMARLHRRLRWRGWLPSLDLRFAVDDQSDWSHEDDEAFVTGAKRFLRDRDRGGGRDYEGSASLTWDFGDAVFDAETVDLAREERQWIGLRDDVLDEVNQLYFERQALLQRLAAEPGPAGPERAQISLRASELAAGLDGWTAGWFSTASRSIPPPAPSPGPSSGAGAGAGPRE